MPIELPLAPSCPEPIACAPPPTWALELELPATWGPGQRLELVIGPGWDRIGGGICAHVEGRTKTGDETSATATLLSSPECWPVSEPPASSLALAGALAVVGIVQLRRRAAGR